MATPLPTDPDTIVVASTTSNVAPYDLAAAIATVQAMAAASHEHVAAIKVMPQQEQFAMATTAATTTGAATAPTDLATATALADLVAAFTALQACVTTAEAET
jgi:hypothetical protein